ncbi:MAG: Maf family protein [Clostridia bacterium]|nr:Maf family protein [Clostridia bacterium]
MELILASGSPRRREMFDLMGLSYTLRPSDADESLPPCAPSDMVETLALRKAASIKKSAPGCCVVGADTVVYLDGHIIGKPADEADASRILHMLSGRTHTVYTGVAILTDEKQLVFHETTDVTFATLSEAEIADYIASGEPMDKAGAYGVQGIGAVLVEKVEGCYFNIIGLPIPTFYRKLAEAGILPAWRRRL